VVSFLARYDPAALDGGRRAAFDEDRLAAGRWGLSESEALAERGEAGAAEALLRRALAALAGTAAEPEGEAASRRVRERVEAVTAAATAAAAREALVPAEAAVAAARPKAAGGRAAEGLADLLLALEAAPHPEARARLEREVAVLRKAVRAAEGRADLRRKADRAIAKGDYRRAREILRGLVDGAAADTPTGEAARDRAKLEGLEDLEETREPEALAALRKGLRWLAKQQLPDGSFGAPEIADDGRRRTEEERRKAPFRTGTTGLAALALLGHVRHDVADEFEPALDRALAWILAAQKADGTFAPAAGPYLYEHAICTLVLVEADRVLRRQEAKPAARKALLWLQEARNPDGGWRYQPRRPPSDVSVTGWALQALLHARAAGYEVDPACIEGAFAFVDRLTDPVTRRTNYMVAEAGRPSMTAVALFCRLRAAQGPEDDRVRLAADYLVQVTPDKPGMRESAYAVFYASDAMSRLGGEWWRKWAPSLKKSLLGSQVKKGDAEGAWPTAGDVWGRGRDAGPVFVAALNALSLENFFEHREH
jgi:hypothetical protein